MKDWKGLTATLMRRPSVGRRPAASFADVGSRWLGPLLAAMALAGCLRAGFDRQLRVDAESEGVGDRGVGDRGVSDLSEGGASQGDGSAGDAGAPEGWLFDTPLELTVLNSGQGEDDPALPASMLEILFDSNRSGSGLWRATRATVDQPWSAPQAIPLFDGGSSPWFSADGLTLHLILGGEIVRTTRPNLGASWSPLVAVAGLSTANQESSVALSADERYAVISSELPRSSLLEASRPTASDPWSTPQLIGALTTSQGQDSAVWLNAAATMVLFVSTRPGGRGGKDIWVATRANRSVPFEAPNPLTSLNSADEEEDPWLSPDGSTCFFSRSIGGIKRLYTARRR